MMASSLSDQIKKIQVTTTYQTFVKEYMALLWSLIIISIILNIYFPKNVYITFNFESQSTDSIVYIYSEHDHFV